MTSEPPLSMVAGIDACKAGWVAVVASASGYEHADVAPTMSELASRLEVEVLAIDIPIGLPDSAEPRSADEAARNILGRRSGTVFSVPPRAVLEAEPYAAAYQLSLALTGRGITVYTYGLRAKILEVDSWRDQELRIVREVHPEVSFRVLADSLGVGPPASSKKSWAGVAQRMDLIRGAGLEVPADIGRAGSVGADDVLDAAVAAWTARRVAHKTALSFPSPAPVDDRGLVAIWA